MKLLSATIRNYRLHREATVDFDPSRTLIGGPNEVGKSTFIEAVHRGLFLKAKGTGALHKSMKSVIHTGHPAVDVSFTAGGKTYKVQKFFSGQSGTTQLAEVNGHSWQGDDAEEKLASVLRSEDVAGRATANRINEQWDHLWVWQGKSGNDPAEHAASQQAELLQRLQATGGAVAMLSELDGKVANRFAEARGQVFVRSGKAKAGSDLDRAQTEVSQAQALYTTARERLDKLQQAVTNYEAAKTTLERTSTDLDTLRGQQQDILEKIAKAEDLQQVERGQETNVGMAKDNLVSLETTEQSIVDLQIRITELQNALEPKQSELREAEAGISELRKHEEQADRELQEAQVATRSARLRRDLAAAYLSVHEKQARVQEIQKRLKRVGVLQRNMDDHRRLFSGLPEIDRNGLEELQNTESELGRARAALNAMAAEIEIVAADQAIQVGDQPLETGGSRTISETTDVSIGDSVCLRIYPGGGDSLAEAREIVRSLREQLQNALDRHGLESVKQASKVVATREDLQGKINGAKETLDDLDAEEVETSYSDAQEELITAEAEVARRLENVKDLDAPEGLAAARALRSVQDKSVREAEDNEISLKATRDALHQQGSTMDGQLAILREGIVDDQASLTGAEAQLDLLLKNHGDDAARATAIAVACKALADAEHALAKTERTLKGLQPERLASDCERLERSVSGANSQREDAQTAKAVNLSILCSEGTDDPKASLDLAEARFNAAQEHLQSVSRKAAAIVLLDDIFQGQQQALADEFSQPLADKITDYLQCLFGADAHAVVLFKDNAVQSIDLARSSQTGAMAFDVLSGGTREQVAAAVRLAIAELLAAEHDGSLPVVFDDAFAYSDPKRVHVLQRMLDLGAERGLQVIVLTCNPSDYAALGARQVILVAETAQPAGSSPSESSPTAEMQTGQPVSECASPPSAAEEDTSRFLAMLTELGGKSGNKVLREQLGWEESKYAAVKAELIEAGRVVPGRGRGGSVAVSEQPPAI